MSHSPQQIDRDSAREAVRALLRALGQPLDVDPELSGTPERVVSLMADELLDGYRADVAEILRDGVEATERGLVVLEGIRYTSMCPHHLLPSEGLADVAYLPGARVVGLGTLVRLVDAFAHRLTLQETMGRAIAEALVSHVGADGAGVRLRAQHGCLAHRGPRQAGARFVTVSLAGSFVAPGPAQDLFVAALRSLDPGDVP